MLRIKRDLLLVVALSKIYIDTAETLVAYNDANSNDT